jgi:hypothetical protein
MSDVGDEQISDFEITQRAIDSRLLDLHTSFPAKVESYSPSANTVDVVPCLNRSLPDGSGNVVSEALPKIAGVPVCFPRSGNYGITFPIQAGDFVFVVCAQRNIGNWRSTGAQGDPGDLGMHTLDGAVAIPGVYPDAKALSSAAANKMVLGKDDTPSARIEITSSGVNLGAGATKGVARAGDNLTASTAMAAWALAVETGVAAGGGGSVSPTFAASVKNAGLLGVVHGASTKITAVD